MPSNRPIEIMNKYHSLLTVIHSAECQPTTDSEGIFSPFNYFVVREIRSSTKKSMMSRYESFKFQPYDSSGMSDSTKLLILNPDNSRQSLPFNEDSTRSATGVYFQNYMVKENEKNNSKTWK